MASADDLKDAGNKLFGAGEWLKAAATYTQAIKLSPDNAVLYSNRSAALLKLKKVTKALEDADKCIELRPEWEKGYFRKGSALEEQDKLQEALEVYQTALKCVPEGTSSELSQKIRTLSKLVNKKAHATPAQAAATGAIEPIQTPHASANASSRETVYDDLGSEEVAKFAEEYLALLAQEISEQGANFIPMVHLLPGPNAQSSDEVQPHIRGAGAWETPQMLEGFLGFLRNGAEVLDAQAVLSLVPKSSIGWPQTWTKPKWPCGTGSGVFAQLESRQVQKLWFVPVVSGNKPGTPVALDYETFGVIPGRVLRA